jgi:integration host factor subunit beta
MTKAEFIAELAASRPQLRRSDVELIVQTVFDRIIETLAQGGRVELRGFGTFGTKQRDARAARNPQTGEAVSVAAKVVPFFRTGRILHNRLNRRD